MAKRHFLMLAQKYDPFKHPITGEYVSEKLDGMRFYWDGGITRGMVKHKIPWSNTAKDPLEMEKIATGLWSRYGHPIYAPDEFLDGLPLMPLDGELYDPDRSRQQILSAVKKHKPVLSEWENIKAYAFDIPPYERVFKDGRINEPQYKKKFEGILDWIDLSNLDYCPPPALTFEQAYFLLQQHAKAPSTEIVRQHEIPFMRAQANTMLNKFMGLVLDAGGEGLVIRKRSSFWTPTRSYGLLKFKPFDDTEGTLIGYTTGKGKLKGLIGALVVDYNGHVLHLSGLTDDERLLEDYTWAAENPGENLPDDIEAICFTRGDKITFKYRGMSDTGVPQEARYWRKR